MIQNLMTQFGFPARSLYRYGFTSPLTLGGSRRGDERWMRLFHMTVEFDQYGFDHQIVLDGIVDPRPLVEHLSDTRVKLAPWSAAMILQQRRRVMAEIPEQWLTMFGFKDAADAVRCRMFLDG
jgi:hypothetical protein